MDVPKAPEFLGVLLGKLVSAGVYSLVQVSNMLKEGGMEPGELLGDGQALNIFGAVLDSLRKEKSEEHMMDSYRKSGLRLEDFLSATDKNRGGKLEVFLEKRTLQNLYPVREYSDLVFVCIFVSTSVNDCPLEFYLQTLFSFLVVS